MDKSLRPFTRLTPREALEMQIKKGWMAALVTTKLIDSHQLIERKCYPEALVQVRRAIRELKELQTLLVKNEYET